MKEELGKELRLIWEEYPLLVLLVSAFCLAVAWAAMFLLNADFLFPFTFLLMIAMMKSLFKWADKSSKAGKQTRRSIEA